MSDGYFGGDVQRAQGAVGRFDSVDALPEFEVSPGVKLRPAAGERLLLSYVVIEPHSEAAVHTHSEEQMGLVVEGSCEFELDGEVRTVGPGDVYHAPPGVPHGARTSDVRCVILDIFSPPRAALVELLEGGS